MKFDLVTIAEARARLEQIVERTRNSFEIQDFAKRRHSMLKVTRPEATS